MAWHSTAPRRQLSADVIVVGGGSAGTVAALAAARQGASVLLVERYGFLGGIGSQVLESLCGLFTTGEPPRKVVGGIPDRIVDGLVERGGAFYRPSTLGAVASQVLQYNPEVLKVVLDDLSSEAGVQPLFHAWMLDVLREEGRVGGVVVATKGGLLELRGAVVVDATGDGDVGAAAGAAYEIAGRGTSQALTTTFRLVQVDTPRARAVPREQLRRLLTRAREQGWEGLPAQEGSLTFGTIPGSVCGNVTRVSVDDPTDPFQLAAAETQGRRQALAYIRFLKERVAGYETAVLSWLGVHIGIRESRRIHGEYRLSVEDVRAARRFEDRIARCGWPIELHAAATGLRLEGLPPGAAYDIPYRCLLPKGIAGLLVAGRCLSADHEAHASVRVMGTCMAMGQAAGVAAALAAKRERCPSDLDAGVVQERLRAMGAVLE
jgi:hypothetical protein